MLENSETSWARIRGHLKVYTLTEMGDKNVITRQEKVWN